MNSVPVLVEAKKEYTNQLQQILTPRLYEGFKSIYNDILKALSDEMIHGNTQSGSVVKLFQKSLKDIPLWNNEMIKNEYFRIEKTSNCDYFEDLIEAVFITNTKILTSVQINNNDSMNIKINVPQPQHFIHKCYIECSKEIYKNPYIFDISKTLTPKEKHTNLRDSLHILNHSISNAIRDLLPIRDILKQGLIQQTMSQEQQQRNKEKFSFKGKDDESESNLTNDDFDEDDDDTDANNEVMNNAVEVDEDDEADEADEADEMHNANEADDANEMNNANEVDEAVDANEMNNEEQKVNNEYSNYQGINETSIIKLDNESNIVNNEVNESEIKEINLNESKVIETPLERKNINFIENNSSLVNFNNILTNSKKPEELRETKQITLGNNPILKRIENVEKVKENNDISQLLKPMNIKPTITKLQNKNLIKKKIIGGEKTNSFYQKKYDQHLANYNYTSESYLDEENSNGLVKNQLNVNYNSSDEEDNNPIELV